MRNWIMNLVLLADDVSWYFNSEQESLATMVRAEIKLVKYRNASQRNMTCKIRKY